MTTLSLKTNHDSIISYLIVEIAAKLVTCLQFDHDPRLSCHVYLQDRDPLATDIQVQTEIYFFFFL